MAIQLNPNPPAVAVPAIAGASLFLDETSNPGIPPRVIDVAADGLTWKDRDNGTTNAVEFGTVVDYKATGPSSTLVLASHRENETNTLGYIFTFDSSSTGNYRYSIDGIPSASGRFANFRGVRTALAPPSLARSVLLMVRTQTSIGTSGQRHLYTFGWEWSGGFPSAASRVGSGIL